MFQEGSTQTLHRPAQNGGYGTSASSAGTASPDLSQHEDEAPKYIEELPLKPYTSINNKIENTNGEIKTVSRVTKSPPPPVPPKPVRHISVNSTRTSYNESIPSEDSGISTHDDRYRISSDSSKSETIENVIVKPTIFRTGEATFVAIGRTPVKQAMYNGHANTDRRRFSSTSSDHADNEHSNSELEEETFSLGRNTTRKSMFVDSPILDRWAELQEERMFVVRDFTNSLIKFHTVCTLTRKDMCSSKTADQKILGSSLAIFLTLGKALCAKLYTGLELWKIQT